MYGPPGALRSVSSRTLARRGRAILIPIALLLFGLSGCFLHSPSSNPPPVSEPKKPAPAANTGVSAVKQVEMKTADGWTILGDLYTPAGESNEAVVLLHQRGGSAKDWKAVCAALQDAGITALAIDQRGAGRSTKGPGSSGDDAPWVTTEDIAAAVGQLKGIKHIGLAGASYGANNALIYAAAHPEEIAAAALVSPGDYGHGLDALQAARTYPGHLAIYHGNADTIAGIGPNEINSASQSSDHLLTVYDDNAHGTALLNQDRIDSIVVFFGRTLK